MYQLDSFVVPFHVYNNISCKTYRYNKKEYILTTSLCIIYAGKSCVELTHSTSYCEALTNELPCKLTQYFAQTQLMASQLNKHTAEASCSS